jgi:transposase
MRKAKKHYSAEEKVAILRRHLLDKVPSRTCVRLGLRPTVFYRWQKELFENGAAAFQAQERPHRQVEEKQKRIEFLEKKVQTKDEVLAELMAEHIALKKTLGEL